MTSGDHRAVIRVASSATAPPVAHRLPIGTTIVGRGADAAVTVGSDHVSRRHAELSWDGRRLRIRDLGSRNGTTVDGRAAVDWIDLRDGDEVRLGPVVAVVEVTADDAGATRPVAAAYPDDDPRDPSARPVAHDPSAPPRPGDADSVAAPSAAPRPAPARGDGSLSRVPVFVSHSSEDKATARAIAQYLERRGWRVWIDEAGIAGGKQWHGELLRALEATWVVLLVVSLPAMRSRWVIREVQAADRLGLHIIPVIVDDVPYPDELRMILAGVQGVHLTAHGDASRRNQQLARLDAALIAAARAGRPVERGRVLTAVGRVIGVIGITGCVLGFALFAYLGITEVSNPSTGGGIPPPFIGWGVFFVSMIVAAIGEGMRRAGLKKGI